MRRTRQCLFGSSAFAGGFWRSVTRHPLGPSVSQTRREKARYNERSVPQALPNEGVCQRTRDQKASARRMNRVSTAARVSLRVPIEGAPSRLALDLVDEAFFCADQWPTARDRVRSTTSSAHVSDDLAAPAHRRGRLLLRGVSSNRTTDAEPSRSAWPASSARDRRRATHRRLLGRGRLLRRRGWLLGGRNGLGRRGRRARLGRRVRRVRLVVS